MNNISSPQYYSEPITIFEASRDGQYLAQLKGGRALILDPLQIIMAQEILDVLPQSNRVLGRFI